MIPYNERAHTSAHVHWWGFPHTWPVN